jgi:hypothetical protein
MRTLSCRFGPNHVQAAEFGCPRSELDVGTAPGHVGGNRHGIALSGTTNDCRFDFVIAGIQHLVGNPVQPGR